MSAAAGQPLTHTVRRKGARLVVTMAVDLADVQQGRVTAPRLLSYLRKVGSDVLEVAEILRSEGEVGEVKWFDDAKGFGFLRTLDHEDVFLHHTGIAGEGFRTLKTGQRVRFHRREGRETTEAFDVTLVGPDEP